jgi:hypothetical protein
MRTRVAASLRTLQRYHALPIFTIGSFGILGYDLGGAGGGGGAAGAAAPPPALLPVSAFPPSDCVSPDAVRRPAAALGGGASCAERATSIRSRAFSGLRSCNAYPIGKTETNRIHLVLFDMQNRTAGPCLARAAGLWNSLLGAAHHCCFSSTEARRIK